MSKDDRSGVCFIVPYCGVPSQMMLTQVPRGNISGTGSVLLQERPHGRPPSYLTEAEILVTGRLPLSSRNEREHEYDVVVML